MTTQHQQAPFNFGRAAASCATALLLVSALLLGPAPAQDQRGLRTEIQAPPALTQHAAGTVQSLPGKTKRFALVIGVDQYTDPQVTRLGGAANDARMLADALVRYSGFPADQVILLASNQPVERQPTRGNILRRLSNLAAVVPKDGLLLFSFAGHGIERNNQAFLLPSDAQVSDDVTLLEQTAINVVQIKDWIRKTSVSQVLLLLDACRNDPAAGRAEADNPLSRTYMRGFDFDVRNREVTAFATLYATEIGRRAYEFREKQQGYFTWALVEGLRGAAANEHGEITLLGLVKYLQDTVPRRVLLDLGAGKVQRPFAVVEGYRADELVLSVKDPRASAPAPPPAPGPPAGNSTAPADAAPPVARAEEPSGLVGTVWTGQRPETGEYTIKFQAAGQLLYIVPGRENGRDITQAVKGTWRLSGNRIRIIIGNSYSVLQGTLDGDAMSGEAENIEGLKWHWILFRKD